MPDMNDSALPASSETASGEPPSSDGVGFGRRPRQVLLALAEALLPHDAGIPIAADEENIIKPAKGFLRDLDTRTFGVANFVLFLLNLSPITQLYSFHTFLGLSPEQRVAFLEHWENHWFFPLRLMFFPIKSLLTIMYVIDPRYEEAVGYSPGSLMQDRQRKSGAAGAS